MPSPAGDIIGRLFLNGENSKLPMIFPLRKPILYSFSSFLLIPPIIVAA